MVQSISSSGSSAQSIHNNIFKKLDTDSSGTVDKTEFVAGRPDDVSSNQAGSLFDSFDTKKSGALSETDLMSAFQQMGPPMQSVLLQAQAQSGTDDGEDQGPPDPAQLFATLDTDGDGTITKDEFVAGKPSQMSDEDAQSFFDKISGDNGDSLTQEQFVSGMQNAGPPDGPHGPPPPQQADDSDTDQTLDQLLAALADSADETGQASDTTGTTGVTSADDLLQQFLKAVSSYQSTAYQNSTAATLAQAISVAA